MQRGGGYSHSSLHYPQNQMVYPQQNSDLIPRRAQSHTVIFNVDVSGISGYGDGTPNQPADVGSYAHRQYEQQNRGWNYY